MFAFDAAEFIFSSGTLEAASKPSFRFMPDSGFAFTVGFDRCTLVHQGAQTFNFKVYCTSRDANVQPLQFGVQHDRLDSNRSSNDLPGFSMPNPEFKHHLLRSPVSRDI